MQIYKQNYVCSTICKDIPQVLVLITGEQQYLKKTSLVNEDCLQMASQTKFIDVIGTFDIPIDSIKRIFRHAKDKILDVVITDHMFCIIGDKGVLYAGNVSDNISNLAQQEIILKGSKPWLKANGLEYF